MLGTVLPEHVDLLAATGALGVLVKDHAVPGGIEVIAVGEAADADGNFLSLPRHTYIYATNTNKLTHTSLHFISLHFINNGKCERER
jgi:hypothetical protein